MFLLQGSEIRLDCFLISILFQEFPNSNPCIWKQDVVDEGKRRYRSFYIKQETVDRGRSRSQERERL